MLVAGAATASAAPDDPAAELPPASSVALGAAVGLTTTLRDTRAKVSVQIPPVTAAVYVIPNDRVKDGQVVRAPRKYLPRRPDPACDYYISNFPNDLYVVDIDQPDPEQPGRIRSVGEFPDTKVAMLAFGGLPVTATLHATQARRDGKLIPIAVDLAEAARTTAKGAGKDGATGCDPAWETGFSKATLSRGSVNGRFSDVRVDGRPVDVGDNCRTATPLQLNLTGAPPADGGNYEGVFTGGVLVQQYNPRTVNPANPIPTAPGSSNLTIPPFTGCVGKSGEDFSTLITGMVSGPGNTLAVNQSTVVLTSFDPIENPSLCDDSNEPNCVVEPQHVNAPPPGR